MLVALLAMLPGSARALIVMADDPTPYKSAPTTEFLVGEWGENVDPGWANITRHGIYIGNGWVISAQHTFNDFTTRTDQVNGENFSIVANSHARLRNPRVVTANRDANNDPYSSLADLKLYRLDSLNQFDGTVEQRATSQGLTVQPVTIGSSSLSASDTGGQELVILGDGLVRANAGGQSHTDANATANPSWPTPTACTDCFHLADPGASYPDNIAPPGKLHAIGYVGGNIANVKNWGTNKIERNGSTGEQGTVLWTMNQILGSSRHYYSREIDPVSGQGAFVLNSLAGDYVAQAFDFDEHNFTLDENGNITGGGGSEARAIGGDSGSGVFAWDTASQGWQLHGLLHNLQPVLYENSAGQPITNHSFAVNRYNGLSPDTQYGDLTFISDLSAYHTQIEAYLAAPAGYEWTGSGPDTRFFHLLERKFVYDSSGNVILDPNNPGANKEGLWGDINLDGQISGDGTGDWDTDDLTAFVQGWGHEQASGDIFSWKRGDLNQDGVTNLDDFVLLRQGFNAATGSSLSLEGLVSSTPLAVPEPGAWLLAAAGALTLAGWRYSRCL